MHYNRIKEKDMICSIIWGSLLILIGTSILINIIFGLHIPVVKVFFAALLIYLGISVLLPKKERCLSCFYTHGSNYTHKQQSSGDRYNISFGNKTIDLSHLNTLTEAKTVSIDAQFADVTLKLPANIPVRVESNMSLGSVKYPSNTTDYGYENLHGAEKPLLKVIINCSFASVVVTE
ncbi:hypothetical protein CVU75_00540 [Candidatus Dependentiae bacterium HGW-Dependentiae-1]|nr:MAG: hypothetical protein CVU75_00540 [Candidatus Dependentiae bacterium HGW-Dependentiae-1]